MNAEKKKIRKRREEALRRILREAREKVIVDIEKQLGQQLDEHMTPKLDSA